VSYVCPKCRDDKGLWRGVVLTGWEAVGGDLTPRSFAGRGLEREVDWEAASADGMYGCGECQWEGVRAELVRLGIDGEPLPAVHPAQERLS
jgi:hypothetical protein